MESSFFFTEPPKAQLWEMLFCRGQGCGEDSLTDCTKCNEYCDGKDESSCASGAHSMNGEVCVQNTTNPDDLQCYSDTTYEHACRIGTSSNNDYGYGYGYRDTEESNPEMDGTWPCGWYGMLIWNTDWNTVQINGTQSGSIDMSSQTGANSDYFDCKNHGGEWRAANLTTAIPEWEVDYGGDHYCRISREYYTWADGVTPPAVDSFLCKQTCEPGKVDPDDGTPSCSPTPTIKSCHCNGGDAEPDWHKCFFDGNEQCVSCDDPNKVLVPNRKDNTVTCQPYEPYHLVDCGRDTTGMRVVANSFVAPYSVEACAYWVKQDPWCAGDYFYSLDHLNMTDFKEGNWETYKRVQMKTDPEKRDPGYDWAGEKKTFLKEYEIDFSVKSNKLKSFFMIHKQLQYGCWCRATQDETNPNVAYLFGEWKEQTETMYGFEGNTYKFDVSGEDNKDTYGPRMLMDPLPAHQCVYPNYKIQGLTGYWGCKVVEPKPM
jgi:hypothetical protein